MGIHVLERELIIPASIGQCWAFFSDPRNLAKITPDWLNFEIVTKLPPRIHPGMMIQYRVSPLPGWRTTWLTEISHVEEGRYFVDEQRTGPYRIWHHEHFFEALPEGRVRMLDRVHFVLPPVPFSKLFAQWIVWPKLKEIFDFRERVVSSISAAQWSEMARDGMPTA